MEKEKMIVAGHICIDFTPPFECEPCNRLEEVLSPGKLIHVGPAEFHPGGAVANTGLGMKFLGADVKLMGKVGDDAFGKMVLDMLREHHAGAGMIVDPNSSTSYSAVLAVPGIDRIFLHNPGANDTFSEKDMDYSLCDDALLFHFGYPTVMAGMYRSEGEELTRIFRKVSARGCLTSLDMAAMDENSEAAHADWKKILGNTLPYVDFFMPSIEEILFMLDRERYDELQKRAAGQDATQVLETGTDIVPMAEKLLEMGCSVVILKCGASGFYYKTAGEEAFAEMERRSGIDFSGFADQEGFERSYVPDAVVSGTGAGDTTIAAFLTAVMKGYSFEMCLKLASATGASCVEATDALGGLKSFAELEKKIAAGWKKNR